jgi:hypothetical protein
MRKEGWYLEAGKSFVIPLPEIKVVGAANAALGATA